jgi:hypothetical protein
MVLETCDRNIILKYLCKPRWNMSLALFDHVSKTTFHNLSSLVKNRQNQGD